MEMSEGVVAHVFFAREPGAFDGPPQFASDVQVDGF